MKFTSFASKVLRLTLTRGQRVLARVAFDGVDPIDMPDEADRELAVTMFGGVEHVPAEARHVLALELGRDSGKSTFDCASHADQAAYALSDAFKENAIVNASVQSNQKDPKTGRFLFTVLVQVKPAEGARGG